MTKVNTKQQEGITRERNLILTRRLKPYYLEQACHKQHNIQARTTMDSSNLPLHLLTIDNHHLLLQQELLNQLSPSPAQRFWPYSLSVPIPLSIFPLRILSFPKTFPGWLGHCELATSLLLRSNCSVCPPSLFCALSCQELYDKDPPMLQQITSGKEAGRQGTH